MRSQHEEQTSLPSNLSDNEIDNTNVSPTEDVMEETITEREEDTPTHIGFGNVDGFDMNNPRAEQFTWSTYLKNYAMHERNKKRGRSCF